MRAVEVVGEEGVEEGVSGLIRLWKSVEKSSGGWRLEVGGQRLEVRGRKAGTRAKRQKCDATEVGKEKSTNEGRRALFRERGLRKHIRELGGGAHCGQNARVIRRRVRILEARVSVCDRGRGSGDAQDARGGCTPGHK